MKSHRRSHRLRLWLSAIRSATATTTPRSQTLPITEVRLPILPQHNSLEARRYAKRMHHLLLEAHRLYRHRSTVYSGIFYLER